MFSDPGMIPTKTKTTMTNCNGTIQQADSSKFDEGLNEKRVNLRILYTKILMMFICVVIIALWTTIIASSALICMKDGTNRSVTTPIPSDNEAKEITVWTDCARNYSLDDWYTPGQPPAGTDFNCDFLTPYKFIKVESFLHGDSYLHCNTQEECLQVIATYSDILEELSEYSFFVDNSSNVYGGRSWTCPYLSGQLRIGGLVDGFGRHSSTQERERILHHVTADMFPYARCSGFLADDVTIVTTK